MSNRLIEVVETLRTELRDRDRELERVLREHEGRLARVEGERSGESYQDANVKARLDNHAERMRIVEERSVKNEMERKVKSRQLAAGAGAAGVAGAGALKLIVDAWPQIAALFGS